MRTYRIGVLAFQGGVAEHVSALLKAGKRLKKNFVIVEVRTKEDLKDLDGLVIPGGESTTLAKLCEREDMFGSMKKVPNLFGTCAGAILIAKNITGKADEQETLMCMDITADRNAYGSQTQSFEADIKTALGEIHAVFIRAPRITKIGKGVSVLAKNGTEVVACEEEKKGTYYLATTFHPELTSTLYHEHFLKHAFQS